MNTTFLKYKRITTLLAGISMASIPAVGQAGWSIVDLSNNVGGRYGKVIDLNDSGHGYFRALLDCSMASSRLLE